MSLRDDIVRESLQLGEGAGEQALTMRAIAQKLGISTTTLYAEFSGKDALLHELRLIAVQRLTEILAAQLAQGSLRERLRRMTLSYLQFSVDSPWLYSLMTSAPLDWARLNPNEAEKAKAPTQVLGGVLRQSIDAPLSNDALAIAVTQVWTSIHGLASLMTAGNLHATHSSNPVEVGTIYVDEFIDMIVASLARLSKLDPSNMFDTSQPEAEPPPATVPDPPAEGAQPEPT